MLIVVNCEVYWCSAILFSRFPLCKNWSSFLLCMMLSLVVVSKTIHLVYSETSLCIAVVVILLNQWIRIGADKMFEHSQLVEVTWPWAYQALCFSSGYFAYDQWDMLLHRLYSGWIPSILVHHLVLLVCFTLALYRDVTINYLILTLICEVKTSSFHTFLFISKTYVCFKPIFIFLFLWFV